MPEVKIPKELEDEYFRIVDELYGGNETAALQEAMENFIKYKRKFLSAGSQFDIAFKNISERQSKKEELLDQGISSALKRMEELKKKGFPPIKDKPK